MRIGIGITTRNRPDMLRVSVVHQLAFKPAEAEFVVVEDCSDKPYGKALSEQLGAQYILNGCRQGISKSKNLCIKALDGCDWVFLFDDDCFPRHAGWSYAFIRAAEINDVHHLMYLEEHGIVTPYRPVGTGLVAFYQCQGCMLLFSRKALDVLGGYDSRFWHYGFEHAQISNRAFKARLSPEKYLTIADATRYIFSMDISYAKDNRLPIGSLLAPFGSEQSCDDKDQCNRNVTIFNDTTIRREI
jgi:glycosyltransferase involved in cell wall biosynthesis